jgi:hypothetical protein
MKTWSLEIFAAAAASKATGRRGMQLNKAFALVDA